MTLSAVSPPLTPDAGSPDDGRKSLDRDKARERIVAYLEVEPRAFEAPLSERGLATDLKLGRTPVREALRALSQEDILEVHPTRGTFVKRLTLDEMRELYEVRFALEGLASFLAAERGDLAALVDSERDLAALAQDTSGATPLQEAARVGDRLHGRIFQATGNRTLCRLYETLSLKIRLLMRATRPLAPDRVKATIGEHLALCRCILARQPEQARALMVEHLHHGFEARVALLSSYARPMPDHLPAPDRLPDQE